MMKKAESAGYKRLLNTLYQRHAEHRFGGDAEKAGRSYRRRADGGRRKYIEELGGVPETLLSSG